MIINFPLILRFDNDSEHLLLSFMLGIECLIAFYIIGGKESSYFLP